VLETRIDIGGFVAIVSDTAGLNPTTTDPIEIEGMRRARKVMEESHLRLALLDLEPQHSRLLLSEEGRRDPHLFRSLLWAQHEETLKVILTYPNRSILVINKIDLLDPYLQSLQSQLLPHYFAPPQCPELPVCFVSCLSGHGLNELIRTLEHQITKLYALSLSLSLSLSCS
jgi:tRNA U34 5-carboxymethylaminomethyl modifying GTPase MnmE/TrmE